MSNVRCFFCVMLSPALEKSLSDWIDGSRPRAPHWRWVSRSSLHITLRFCGEIPAAQVKDLSSRVKNAIFERGCAPFELSLQTPGTFGSPPRVFWAGVTDASGSLKKLNALIEQACGDVGLERERKRFSPHITLARISSAHSRDDAAVCGAPWSLTGAAWQVDSVVFMRSHLTETGPRYFPMAKYALRADARVL